MRKKIVTGILGVVLSAMASLAHADFSTCPEFFARGTPPKIPELQSDLKLRSLCFDAFAIMHSGISKTPLYVAERLTRESLTAAKEGKRTNKFYAESRLPSAERAKLGDYASGLQINGHEYRFDRGHMAPAANMPNLRAMAQSFSLANMVPQVPSANRGAWAAIEKATRQYVMRASGDVFTVTGPVFSGDPLKLGDGQVWIPFATYKLVYDATTNRAWAYWLENKDNVKMRAPISYEDLVQRTGIDFLPRITPQ